MVLKVLKGSIHMGVQTLIVQAGAEVFGGFPGVEGFSVWARVGPSPTITFRTRVGPARVEGLATQGELDEENCIAFDICTQCLCESNFGTKAFSIP